MLTAVRRVHRIGTRRDGKITAPSDSEQGDYGR